MSSPFEPPPGKSEACSRLESIQDFASLEPPERFLHAGGGLEAIRPLEQLQISWPNLYKTSAKIPFIYFMQSIYFHPCNCDTYTPDSPLIGQNLFGCGIFICV